MAIPEWLVSAGLGFLAKLILGWIQGKQKDKALREEGRASAERAGGRVIEEIGNEQDARALESALSRDALIERLREKW